jgi:hypothetical protein
VPVGAHLEVVFLRHLGVAEGADVFGDVAVLLAEHELVLELRVAEHAELLRHAVPLAVESRVLGGRSLAPEACPSRELLRADAGPRGHPLRTGHGDAEADEEYRDKGLKRSD